MAAKIQGNITTALEEHKKATLRYAEDLKRDPVIVLAQKGRDVQIRISKGFRERRADKDEISQGHTKRRGRTKVRDSLYEKFRGRESRRIPGRDRRKRGWWTQAQHAEINARRRGVNILSYSTAFKPFSARRKLVRLNQSKKLRSGKKVSETSIRSRPSRKRQLVSYALRSEADGIGTVSDKHNIAEQAIRASSADTLSFLARRQRNSAARRLVRRFPARRV